MPAPTDNPPAPARSQAAAAPRGPATSQAVLELLERSHRLGSDPRNTNYAGGNTSCKTLATDPVTGGSHELLYVKGSGGDLGTLTEPGLAVLRLDRLRALVAIYPGPDREDEMVAAFDFCFHGKGGAAPSIDTAMHCSGWPGQCRPSSPGCRYRFCYLRRRRSLTRACFGERVVWVPWRRPGFPARPRHRRSGGRTPGGRSGSFSAATGLPLWGTTSDRVRGSLSGNHPHRSGLYRRQRAAPTLRCPRGQFFASAQTGATGTGGRPLPRPSRAGQHRSASSWALHRQRHRARLFGQRASLPAGR